MHAFNRNGTVAWETPGAAAYGATTVAGGMVFAGVATSPGVQVRDAGTGSLVTTLAAGSDCFCGIAVSGNAAFFGTGSPQQGTGDGVSAYTPLGMAPHG
jgi:hypothetical protein